MSEPSASASSSGTAETVATAKTSIPPKKLVQARIAPAALYHLYPEQDTYKGNFVGGQAGDAVFPASIAGEIYAVDGTAACVKLSFTGGGRPGNVDRGTTVVQRFSPWAHLNEAMRQAHRTKAKVRVLVVQDRHTYDRGFYFVMTCDEAGRRFSLKKAMDGTRLQALSAATTAGNGGPSTAAKLKERQLAAKRKAADDAKTSASASQQSIKRMFSAAGAAAGAGNSSHVS